MVFSVSPSVIVREVDATAVIPAVATSPAAIAGVFRWGPTDERILITSEDELVSRFGKPYTITSANTAEAWTNHETFFSAADFLSYSNALYVTRVASNDAAKAAGTYFEARYEGDIGNSIRVAVTSSASFTTEIAGVGDANNSISFNSDEITINVTGGLANTSLQAGDILRVGNATVGYQDLLLSAIPTENGDEVTFNFSNRYTLPVLDASELSFERKWGYSGRVGSAPASNTIHISVIDKDGVITGVAGQVLELYENVSVNSNSKLPDGTSNYYVDVLENRSSWIRAKGTSITDRIPDAIISAQITDPIYEDLISGNDGADEEDISFGAIALGYDLYKDPNEVDISGIICGKSTSSNLANYLTQNIAETRKDCVVYVSPKFTDVVSPSNPNTKMENAIIFRNSLTSSSYLVIDSGYKYRYDKYNDTYRWVPLNGDIAGLAARVEPWESPAGYKRGVIKNVVKLAFNPNKAQRDQLYGSDINPVISQVGQGVLLFGDKTALGAATGSAFTRINVRRLFITVEKAIATVAASFLFDFNDEFTQTQFKNLVEPFLRDIQGRRGIIDFRVISDSTVNTPDVIDRNIFRGNIFIKPARSINVIELTFVATRTGVEFDEIVGQPL